VNSFAFGIEEPGPGRHLGIFFHGTKATLLANYGLCKVLTEDGKPIEDVEFPRSTEPSPGHEREFVDCMRSRKEPSCSFARHLPMHIALNLAHIAMKCGRKLTWDAEKLVCVGDREATRLVTPSYRAPWKLPRLGVG
jgi:hypothetical protein